MGIFFVLRLIILHTNQNAELPKLRTLNYALHHVCL